MADGQLSTPGRKLSSADGSVFRQDLGRVKLRSPAARNRFVNRTLGIGHGISGESQVPQDTDYPGYTVGTELTSKSAWGILQRPHQKLSILTRYPRRGTPWSPINENDVKTNMFVL